MLTYQLEHLSALPPARRYWQCLSGAPAPDTPAVPNNTVIVTLYYQFPPGAVACSNIDKATAAELVLKRAKSLSATTGRTFSAGGAPACTDASVSAGASGRRLLQSIQAVLVIPLSSEGPVTTASNEAGALQLAATVLASVKEFLVEVLQVVVDKPGFNAATTAQQMTVRLRQVELQGQALLSSPPTPAAGSAGEIAAGKMHRECQCACTVVIIGNGSDALSDTVAADISGY